MSEKKKTRAELLSMLAEAVRNTQPQPSISVTRADPVGNARPTPKRKTRSVSKRAAEIKGNRASAGHKKQPR